MQPTAEEANQVRKKIQEKYAQVADAARGCFRYPTGEEGLKGLGYPPEAWQDLPGELVASCCGVANPFALGPLPPGAGVLDVGCGAGLDALLAARQVGPAGRVAGIDLTREMVAKARAFAAQLGLAHAAFEQAPAESLPFKDAQFDVVISNGALNLTLDKARAMAEIFRVLRSGGRVRLADMVLVAELPAERQDRLENWYQ